MVGKINRRQGAIFDLRFSKSVSFPWSILHTWVSNRPAHTQHRPVHLRTFGALPWGTPRSVVNSDPRNVGVPGVGPRVWLKVKTDPPYLRGSASGHPEVYRVNPDPRNVRDPVLDTLLHT